MSQSFEPSIPSSGGGDAYESFSHTSSEDSRGVFNRRSTSDSSSNSGQPSQGLFSPLTSPAPGQAYKQLIIGTQGAHRFSKNGSRSSSPQVGQGSDHVDVQRTPSGSLVKCRSLAPSPTIVETQTGGNTRNLREVPQLVGIASGRQVSERTPSFEKFPDFGMQRQISNETFLSDGSFPEIAELPAESGLDPTVKGRAKKAFKRWATWPHILELVGLAVAGIAIYATHASLGAILGQIVIPIPGVGLLVGGAIGASLSTAAAATLGGVLNLAILQIVYSATALGVGACRHRRIVKSEENRVWRAQQQPSLDALWDEHNQLDTNVPPESIEAGAELLRKLAKCISKNKRKQAEQLKDQIETNFVARRACQNYNAQAKKILADLPNTVASIDIRVKYRNQLRRALSSNQLKEAEKTLESFSLDVEREKKVHGQIKKYKGYKKEHEELNRLLPETIDPTRERRGELLDALFIELKKGNVEDGGHMLRELKVCLEKAKKNLDGSHD